jgi:hypothetical protein
MREPLTAESLEAFIRALGNRAKTPARIYLVGGASAVLMGWRTSTIDVDLKIIPESDEILRSLPQLKEELKINIELASPDDFIPPLPGWQERSQFIQQRVKLSFYHYDFYAQALAKIERSHEVDLADVDRMFTSGLIIPEQLLELFSAIEPDLYRYPQVDPKSFRRAVEQTVKKYETPLPADSQ